MKDIKWKRGGRRGGRAPHPNNMLVYILECSIARHAGPQVFTRLGIFNLNGEKLTLRFMAHKFVVNAKDEVLNKL